MKEKPPPDATIARQDLARTFVTGEGPPTPHSPTCSSQIQRLISNFGSKQDLSRDPLISSAPRVDFDSGVLPVLGGIPLLQKLGQGGMGAVYYGIHPRLELEVAVKVLSFNIANERPETIQRFFQEAKLAARIKSPHLVGVLDVNRDDESGLFYLVMEYIPGLSAGAFLHKVRREGMDAIPEEIALAICISACEGLAVAHAAGVIHRDIKPDNILIPADGTGSFKFTEGKLADLGMARQEESSHSLTGQTGVMGTPGFMSPEQTKASSDVSKASDIFSMGATLYNMLVAAPPFSESSLIETLNATISKPHIPIWNKRKDVSLPTARLIDKCLSKNPKQRFPDAKALLDSMKLCRAALDNPHGSKTAEGPVLTKVEIESQIAAGNPRVGSGKAYALGPVQPLEAQVISHVDAEWSDQPAAIPSERVRQKTSATAIDHGRFMIFETYKKFFLVAFFMVVAAVVIDHASNRKFPDAEHNALVQEAMTALAVNDIETADAKLEQAGKIEDVEPHSREQHRAAESLATACALMDEVDGDLDEAENRIIEAERYFPNSASIQQIRLRLFAKRNEAAPKAPPEKKDAPVPAPDK